MTGAPDTRDAVPTSTLLPAARPPMPCTPVASLALRVGGASTTSAPWSRTRLLASARPSFANSATTPAPTLADPPSTVTLLALLASSVASLPRIVACCTHTLLAAAPPPSASTRSAWLLTSRCAWPLPAVGDETEMLLASAAADLSTSARPPASTEPCPPEALTCDARLPTCRVLKPTLSLPTTLTLLAKAEPPTLPTSLAWLFVARNWPTRSLLCATATALASETPVSSALASSPPPTYAAPPLALTRSAWLWSRTTVASLTSDCATVSALARAAPPTEVTRSATLAFSTA